MNNTTRRSILYKNLYSTKLIRPRSHFFFCFSLQKKNDGSSLTIGRQKSMESKFDLEVPISQLTYSNVKMSPPLHVVPYYIHGFYSLCELLPLYPSRYGRFEVLRETCSYLPTVEQQTPSCQRTI